MPMPFKEGVNISDLKQAPFNLSKKDRDAIDEILDLIYKDRFIEKVPLGQPCLVALPAFIV